jgi:hypothetical protein
MSVQYWSVSKKKNVWMDPHKRKNKIPQELVLIPKNVNFFTVGVDPLLLGDQPTLTYPFYPYSNTIFWEYIYVLYILVKKELQS